jgi:hypothetical protein
VPYLQLWQVLFSAGIYASLQHVNEQNHPLKQKRQVQSNKEK